MLPRGFLVHLLEQRARTTCRKASQSRDNSSDSLSKATSRQTNLWRFSKKRMLKDLEFDKSQVQSTRYKSNITILP